MIIPMRQMFHVLLALVVSVFLIELLPLKEHAATSPATLIQLATSSPAIRRYNTTRPVRQRGMYFADPSYER